MSDGEIDRKAEFKHAARTLAAGFWAGLISGFLFIGVAGRLAMFILRLTSDPSVIGMETDDGFVIGEFTTETSFVLLGGAAVGAFGGLLYLLVRDWVPREWRVLSMALFFGVIGGSTFVHADGIDFTLLEPRWLAIVMFVVIPVLYGGFVAYFAEKFLSRNPGERSYSWIAALVPLIPVLLAGPPGLLVLVVVLAGWFINTRVPLTQFWTSEPVTWIGRAWLIGLAGWELVALSRDVSQIL